ncbi:MAG: homoserine kinase [Chloroflexi bacterium]|nr:homoserine kinase [Chloroflexota bacterium]
MSRLGWLAELDGRRVVVEVPATAANLGAGYDCVGMALDLVDRVAVEVVARPDAAIELAVEGEGAGELPADRSNRLVRGLDAALAAAWDGDPSALGWRIRMTNSIPLSRGLGSSAAATVAGVVAADALTGGSLSRRRMLEIAVGIEGHPDNAAPALLGGFTVAGSVPGSDGTVALEAIRFDVPAQLRAVLFIPDLPLATAAMRAALPDVVPHADAVHNIAAVGLGVAGLASGRCDLLRALTVDRIHEPYRASAYPQLPGLVAAARGAGALGACMSGAGSTIIAFVDDAAVAARVAAALAERGAAEGLAGRTCLAVPRAAGARVVEQA